MTNAENGSVGAALYRGAHHHAAVLGQINAIILPIPMALALTRKKASVGDGMSSRARRFYSHILSAGMHLDELLER